jgi:hypothetical protein
MSDLEKTLGLDLSTRDQVEDAWYELLSRMFGIDAPTAQVVHDVILSNNPDMVLPPNHWFSTLPKTPPVMGSFDHVCAAGVVSRPVVPMNPVQIDALEQGRLVCPNGMGDDDIFTREDGEEQVHYLFLVNLDERNRDVVFDVRRTQRAGDRRYPVAFVAERSDYWDTAAPMIMGCTCSIEEHSPYWWAPTVIAYDFD